VGITSIVTLHLYGLPLITSTELGPLGSLSNLQDLELGVCGFRVHQVPHKVFDITPLALCGQLVSLNLRCQNVEDLSPLATCTNLQKVILDYCPGLTRLTGLGSCLQLTDVSIRDSAVRCICDLIGCTRLTMLDVTRCWQVRLPILGVPFWARGGIEGRSDIRSFMELMCKNNVPGRETNNIPLRDVQDMRPTTSLCVYHGHNYDPLFW
jgi:Leucine-rich repeat (LRR) protein